MSLTYYGANSTTTYNPAGWYMSGGSAGPFQWRSDSTVRRHEHLGAGFDDISAVAVPEPTTWGLLLPALGGLLALRRGAAKLL